MGDLIGREMDHYRILEEIAEDSWGTLFKAYSSELKHDVLLHLLNADRIGKPGMHEHFTQMARASLHWRHPAIARTIDFRESVRGSYIVREYFSGDNLQDLLERLREYKKVISISEAIHVTRQVLDALEYLHQRGITHGDLTPQSIFLREEPSEGLLFQPVLVNSGFNKPDMPFQLSLPIYNPPELSAGKPFNHLSDIYTTGLLLYEMTTGKTPSFSSSSSTPDDQQSALRPPSLKLPRAIRPELPEDLEEIILKATATDPQGRYSSAVSMSLNLLQALKGMAKLETSPIGNEHVTSLMWAINYRRSEADEISSKVESGEPNQEIPDSLLDKIHILLADKTIHTVIFKPPSMTIGRGNDNDIVLNQPGVSRHHARIEYDRGSYWVVDLDSRNGSYLGSERLEPGKPHVWLKGQNLRVSDTWMRIERLSQDKSTITAPTELEKPEEQRTILEPGVPFLHPDGEGIDLAQVKFSPGKAFLGVYLEAPTLTVSPGGQANTSLLLVNQAPDSDQFRITFIGIPLDWLPNRPQSIKMQPASQRYIPITLQPARSAESQAGHHIVTIRVSSQNDPTQVVEISLSITISAFAQFASEVQPSRLKPGGSGQVTIRNMGNLPETYSVGWDTKRAGLSFIPPSAKITLPPGHSGSIQFEAKSNQRRWFGNEDLISFGVIVSSKSGQFQTHKGVFANRPLIPTWAPLVLLILCLALACGGLVFINQVTVPARRAQETDAANRTALAFETSNAITGITSTAQANTEATQSSGQSATATADWFLADDDQDGLPNSQEALFNTHPDQPDTDQDGIKDGDEIQIYKTNPLMSDTDGDGIKDGEETTRNLDPLKRDTDNDGLEDGADPDPINASTPTTSSIPASVTPTLLSATQIPATDLSILVDSGATTAVPGASMSYTIRVRNNGPSHVTSAQVLDTLPEALENINWTCTASTGSFCRGSNGFGNINMLVDVLVGGEINFLVSGSVSPGATGSVTNSASVSPPAGFIESNSANNVATDIDILTPKVSYTLTITDNRSEISPGQTNVYTIVATNNGPSTAVGIVITNVIPNVLTSLSWTCTASAGSYCQPGGTQSGNVNASGTIRPGGSLSITVNTRVKDDSLGTITNTVYLSSPIDPATNNKTAIDETTITLSTNLVIDAGTPIASLLYSAHSNSTTITHAGSMLSCNEFLSN